MTILYNPDWHKRNDSKEWRLVNPGLTGVVYPQVTRDYKWEIYYTSGSGAPYKSGSSPDCIQAFSAVEKEMGYKFFLEKDYVASKGCRCGSCVDETGKWMVYTRDDTVNMLFNSESEAINWILTQHAESK
jgi:hypothetical protein